MKTFFCVFTGQISTIQKAFFSVVLGCLFVPMIPAKAQGTARDEGGVRSFVNSAAKGVYTLAWPTATYREVSLDSFKFVPGGCNIVVKLSGNTRTTGRDLWVRLVLFVRNGAVADVEVKDDNHIAIPPFMTSRLAGTLVLDVAKASARHNFPEPAAHRP